MYLKELAVEGVGGINSLVLKFDRSMNIVCGPNGIGKSTILDTIAHCFSAGGTKVLRKNALAEASHVSAVIGLESGEQTVSYQVTKFRPQEDDNLYSSMHNHAREVILFGVNRTFTYVALQAVSRDAVKNDHQYWSELRSGVTLTDTKNWFVNRFLYSAHKNALTDAQLANLEAAKSCFSLLDPEFEFDGVEASSNEIMIQTPGGRIYYEYLSSGFKSCLSIMFAIIKEVEFRFSDQMLEARNFNGIVLIDEIEIHLHPVWQSKIAKLLIELFPKAQFICTTHSPHVIQSADREQIIALERHKGKVRPRALPASPYGFKNWTLDEVLMDVMGMEDTRSEEFNDLLARFNSAIDNEDASTAKAAFEQFDASLHPNNHLRKLLKMQLAEIIALND